MADNDEGVLENGQENWVSDNDDDVEVCRGLKDIRGCFFMYYMYTPASCTLMYFCVALYPT